MDRRRFLLTSLADVIAGPLAAEAQAASGATQATLMNPRSLLPREAGDRMSGRMRLVAVLLSLAVMGSSVPAGAQVHISSEERFFRIEWQLERAGGRDAAIVGSLNNHYRYALERIQLQAQVLDEAGQITHETLATMNDVPPGGRGDFRLRLPAIGARYVVTVHAFQFGPQESP